MYEMHQQLHDAALPDPLIQIQWTPVRHRLSVDINVK